MCAFKHCKVKSDEVILKENGIVAYKLLEQRGGRFYSLRGMSWVNGKMKLQKGTKINTRPNGKGPGIYAYKREPWRQRSHVRVKVLLYGRVVEYAEHKATHSQPGYMAQRAEILEVIK